MFLYVLIKRGTIFVKYESAEVRRMGNGDRRPIGVFDSGVGGISVLAELTVLMPHESFLYFGDSLRAPYGSRTNTEVSSLTERHIDTLIRRGVKAVVIACNTATGLSIDSLRRKYEGMPVIGIEPAIKPAVRAFPEGRVLVLATPITVGAEKFQAQLQQHSAEAEISAVPCPRLAGMIEAGTLSGAHLDRYLAEIFRPYRDRPIDAVVLGCTHYPFVEDAIAAASGGAEMFDGGEGTARETKRQLEMRGMLSDREDAGTVEIDNSDPQRIRFCEELLAAGQKRCREKKSKRDCCR